MIFPLTLAIIALNTVAAKTFYQDNKFVLQRNVPQRRRVFSTVDQNLTLTCTIPQPWFFCVWEGPRGDRLCGLRDKLGTGGSGLCGEEERFTITGQSTDIVQNRVQGFYQERERQTGIY